VAVLPYRDSRMIHPLRWSRVSTVSTRSQAVIRLLTIHDLEEALALSNAAGWNQLRDDWRMLLTVAPCGSFAALHDDRLVGTAIGIDYGAFAWIAMMLVDPGFRSQGIGRRLLEATIDAVPPHVPVRLDATPLGRPLYQKYGFKDEATLARYVRDPAGSTGNVASSSRVRRMTEPDVPLVSECDRQAFGGERTAVLEWAFRNTPQYAHVVPTDSGLMNYGLGRRGRVFDQIGPVIADEDERAQALVSAALEAAGDRPVAIDAFGAHHEFTAWLGARGFTSQRPLFRMHLPRRSRQPARSASIVEFAILGPEFG
jgi:GNAT superfamily N-acetyltransferase